MQVWKHFKTITNHKRLVMQGCFKVGLYWQGITHDLSKYTPAEFLVGARYFQGTRSPNAAEREDKGYSEAWMHHKGRNRHHYEYWQDVSMTSGVYEPVPMPRRYLVEMVMDRRAASMIYKGKDYTSDAPYQYFIRSAERNWMRPQTRQELDFLLTMLRDEGEEKTFRYLKDHVLPGKPFPWEE